MDKSIVTKAGCAVCNSSVMETLLTYDGLSFFGGIFMLTTQMPPRDNQDNFTTTKLTTKSLFPKL